MFNIRKFYLYPIERIGEARLSSDNLRLGFT
jgi:hypothetical protein